MKKHLLLLMLFVSINAIGQSYRTVVPGTESWFVNSMDQLNAIHCDSVTFSGSDTIVWNYPILRDNNFTWVLDTMAPSWVGRYSVQHSSGEEIYLNDSMDTITFLNYLPLNSVWRMYNFSNGDYIQAKISSVTFMNVGPVSDSVKTISLQQYNSTNQQVAGNFNGLSFQVSKSNGFIQLYDLFNFPYDNSIWTRTDAHRLTYGEVFDFNIGDEFHSVEDYAGLQAPQPKFVRTVIAKNNWSPDSIQYIFHYEHTWYTVINMNVDTFYVAAPETLMVYNLNNYIFPEFPKEPIHNFPNISSYEMDFSHFGSCRPLEIQYINGLYVYNPDSLFYPLPFEATTESYDWINGNGEYDGYSSLSSMYYWAFYLVFSKKGIDSCGFPLNMGIYDGKMNQNEISIYPNPTSSEIHINYFSTNAQKINLSIRNIEGKELFLNENMVVQQGENNLPFEISSLANGMYFIVIKDDSGLHAIKFLKQ
jgi:hypothetical protein